MVSRPEGRDGMTRDTSGGRGALGQEWHGYGFAFRLGVIGLPYQCKGMISGQYLVVSPNDTIMSKLCSRSKPFERVSCASHVSVTATYYSEVYQFITVDVGLGFGLETKTTFTRSLLGTFLATWNINVCFHAIAIFVWNMSMTS